MLNRHRAALAIQALRNRFPQLEVLPGTAAEPLCRLPLSRAGVEHVMVLPADDGFVVWLGHFTPGWCATAGLLADLFTELTRAEEPRASAQLKRAQGRWLQRLLSRSGGWVFNEAEGATP
jgi:hypothetical protein